MYNLRRDIDGVVAHVASQKLFEILEPMPFHEFEYDSHSSFCLAKALSLNFPTELSFPFRDALEQIRQTMDGDDLTFELLVRLGG
jgi:hypothetical protein